MDCERRWGLLPIPESSLPSWARTVPITDRLPAMVAMIASCEIDVNSVFIGLFSLQYYISPLELWRVKFESWTRRACLTRSFPIGHSRQFFIGLLNRRMTKTSPGSLSNATPKTQTYTLSLHVALA